MAPVDNSYNGPNHPSNSNSYGPPGPQPQQPQDHNGGPSWGYTPSTGVDRSTTYPPPILPSIHTFAAVSSQPTAWENSDGYHHGIDPNDSKTHEPNAVYASTPYGHPQQHPQHQSIQLSSSTSQQPPHPGYAPPYAPAPTTTTVPNGANFSTNSNTTAVNTQSNGNNDSRNGSANATANAPVTTSYPPMPSPRLAYTRTLVGPLSANACRLQDEHRKPGIFFLFQDLSVRTEGMCFYSYMRYIRLSVRF